MWRLKMSLQLVIVRWCRYSLAKTMGGIMFPRRSLQGIWAVLMNEQPVMILKTHMMFQWRTCELIARSFFYARKKKQKKVQDGQATLFQLRRPLSSSIVTIGQGQDRKSRNSYAFHQEQLPTYYGYPSCCCRFQLWSLCARGLDAAAILWWENYIGSVSWCDVICVLLEHLQEFATFYLAYLVFCQLLKRYAK